MSQTGTTSVEVKSGYGLELEPELKLLRILTNAQRDCQHFIETSITYCGAHSVPKVRIVVKGQHPTAKPTSSFYSYRSTASPAKPTLYQK